jgi:hypothetical protein
MNNKNITAGYSGTPLIKKLGIKQEAIVLLINEPDDYFDLLGIDISSQVSNKNEQVDFIHLFVKSNKEFGQEMKMIKKSMKPTTILWVSWYKKNSKIPTDITEDIIRNYALQNDLVDVKVCAVSDVWSGLKLVPLAKR